MQFEHNLWVLIFYLPWDWIKLVNIPFDSVSCTEVQSSFTHSFQSWEDCFWHKLRDKPALPLYLKYQREVMIFIADVFYWHKREIVSEKSIDNKVLGTKTNCTEYKLKLNPVRVCVLRTFSPVYNSLYSVQIDFKFARRFILTSIISFHDSNDSSLNNECIVRTTVG